MRYTNGLDKDKFLQHMFEEFPTVFNNTFSRTMLENIVDYGTADNFTHSKNALYYFLQDMIPEIESKDLIPFMDKNLLTNEVLGETEDITLVQTMEELRNYLDMKGWQVSTCQFAGNHIGWEIGQYSPEGEDFWFAIEHDNDVITAIQAIKEYAYDFDEEEHVKLNLDARGAPGLKALVEDASAIQEMLDDLADGVNWCEQKTIGEICGLSSLEDKIKSAAERAGEHHSCSDVNDRDTPQR